MKDEIFKKIQQGATEALAMEHASLKVIREEVLEIAPWLSKYPNVLSQVVEMGGTETDNRYTIAQAVMVDLGWIKKGEHPHMGLDAIEKEMARVQRNKHRRLIE